ncbi:MAG TPA: tRNA pseudouridine(55) synthase TruB [Bacteroidota bacterium]|nr:tRNA pseudouridine(55) synthase TruB [Bacteroidota bacterium]
MNILTNQNSNDIQRWYNESQSNGGFILIDKYEGITSNEVLGIIKSHTHFKKIGHSGTLDPLASGLMIVACNKYTKLINELIIENKAYIGTIKLGATTKSFDRETREESHSDISHITNRQINELTSYFKGKIEQIPPLHSAKRLKGKRAYQYARSNSNIELEPQTVEIFDFQITNIELPFVYFYIQVSKGFYLRSFARDFGKQLGIPSYLYYLRRIMIGDYRVNDAVTINDFTTKFKNFQEN